MNELVGDLEGLFCSCGSEGVEAAIKFARANTGRSALHHAQGAFHGLTWGTLFLMDNPFWSQGFGPLLAETAALPFGRGIRFVEGRTAVEVEFPYGIGLGIRRTVLHDVLV